MQKIKVWKLSILSIILYIYIKLCFISFKLVKEIERTKITCSFIENKDNFFRLGFKPLILILFVKLYKQKGKMKKKISNMKWKIQIEVKDLINYHLESISDCILSAALIFPSS